MSFLKALFAKLFSAPNLSRQDEAFLSQASDHADLEQRMRRLERTAMVGAFGARF